MVDLWLTLALSGSLWLSLALSGPLWLSLALVGSIWLALLLSLAPSCSLKIPICLQSPRLAHKALAQLAVALQHFMLVWSRLFSIHPQATPLFLACMCKAWDSALLLLSKGADPNKAARDKDGDVRTPLLCAISEGSIDICKRLLESGASQDPFISGDMKEVKQAPLPFPSPGHTPAFRLHG